MTTAIRFKVPPRFDHKGRNGYLKAGGVVVTDVGGEIFIEPLNGRGDLSEAARLVVPKEHLPDLIAALEALK